MDVINIFKNDRWSCWEKGLLHGNKPLLMCEFSYRLRSISRLMQVDSYVKHFSQPITWITQHKWPARTQVLQPICQLPKRTLRFMPEHAPHYYFTLIILFQFISAQPPTEPQPINPCLPSQSALSCLRKTGIQ